MLLYSCAVTSIIFLLLQTLLNIIIYLLFHRFQVKSEILIWNIIYAGISTKPEPASITKQKTLVPRLESLEVQCTYMYYATHKARSTYNIITCLRRHVGNFNPVFHNCGRHSIIPASPQGKYVCMYAGTKNGIL